MGGSRTPVIINFQRFNQKPNEGTSGDIIEITLALLVARPNYPSCIERFGVRVGPGPHAKAWTKDIADRAPSKQEHQLTATKWEELNFVDARLDRRDPPGGQIENQPDDQKEKKTIDAPAKRTTNPKKHNRRCKRPQRRPGHLSASTSTTRMCWWPSQRIAGDIAKRARRLTAPCEAAAAEGGLDLKDPKARRT